MLPKFELSRAGEQIEGSGKGGQTMHKYYFEPVKVEMPNRYEVEVCGKQLGGCKHLQFKGEVTAGGIDLGGPDG